MLRIMRFLMAGAIGGLIIWALTEPFDFFTPGAPPGQHEPDISTLAYFVFGMIIGLVLGIAIGVAQAMSGMSLRDGVRTVISGACIGAIGGMFGFRFGGVIYGCVASLDPSSGVPVPVAFILNLIGRSLGWGILGASVGAAVGIG